jgi:hypothetical protein
VFLAVTTGATIYHLAGAYPYLLAAGLVAIDGGPRRVTTRAGRRRERPVNDDDSAT